MGERIAVSTLAARTERSVGNKNDWIRVSNFQELREKLTPEPEKVVHDPLADTPLRKPKRVSRPQPTSKSTTTSKSVRVHDFRSKSTDLGMLDAQVRNLAGQIEVRLAFLVGGKAVWNKLRADNYTLNRDRRAALPKTIVALLIELQKTKQEYILQRKTDRYKRLLQSLPEWDLERIAKAIAAAQKKRGVVIRPKDVPVGGVEGYRGETLSRKRYYWNEE